MGIMVWQDFMFSCAMYPEEPPYPALVEAEARHQVARLSSHPSVVLWCGGNECVWAYESWGAGDAKGRWKERVTPGQTWGRGYYFELLPRVIAELDPTRPYWANSPYCGREGDSPNQDARGDRHTWDVRAEGYRSIVPRFCSEFGHQSPPNLSTLARALAPQDLRRNSPALDHRQRGTGGTAKHIDESLVSWFPPAKDFEEWHRQAQEAQARALSIGIKWLRENQPRCMGALLWQFNDAWPGFSWSLIDSDGKPKPAYDAVREAFRDP
jgi:beta-mannosidase